MADTFCVLPWIHSATVANGHVRLCCRSTRSIPDNNSQTPIQLGRNQISDYWNGEYIKDVRLKMNQGLPVAECGICYREEALGKISKRQRENAIWREKLGDEKIQGSRQSTQSTQGRVENGPIYFDLRLGDQCNLMCRMCDSLSSDKILKETQKLVKQGEPVPSYVSDRMHFAEDLGRWQPQSDFWRDIETYLPHMEHVYLTGGEPTLIPEVLDFLDLCISSGRAQKMQLRLNTNVTVIPKHFLSRLNHFRAPEITFSIDGLGAVNEYIRHGSAWPTVLENVEAYLTTIKHGVFSLVPTVSAYNIAYMVEFFRWTDELRRRTDIAPLHIALNLLNEPVFLRANIVAETALDEIRQDIQEYMSEPSAFHGGHDLALCQEVEALLRWLAQPDPSAPKRRDQFRSYTELLDKHRGRNLEAALPKTAQAMNSVF